MTWTWECLVEDCGVSGVEPDYDSAISAAHEHNAQKDHEFPSISYMDNDAVEPEVEPSTDQRVLDALEAAALPDPSSATTEDVANSVNTVVDAVKQALAPQ